MNYLSKIIQPLSIFLLLNWQPIAIANTSTPSQLCQANLSTEIEQIIKQPKFRRSRWGILVESLNSDQEIYNLDGDKYFIPASNVKLLTTAAALSKLGANYYITTPIYQTGSSPNLTSLRIVGQGDPSLTTEDLKTLAQELKKQGIKQIDQLIVSESNLEKPAINQTWEWSDIYNYYAVAVNSLILNENSVELRIFPQKIGEKVRLEWSDDLAMKQWQINNLAITAPAKTPYNLSINGILGKPILEINGELAVDSEVDIWDLAVADSASYFLESLNQIITDSGIKVKQKLINNSAQENTENLWLEIKSDSLEDLINKTNHESNNLFAESLVKLLAKNSNNQSGLEVMKQTLTVLGVDPETYQLTDGSGLSRHNLISPETLVKTLKLMAKTSDGKIYRDSLPIAGVNGTLKNRFLDTNLVGKVQGKTGTMSGVSALSGYVENPGYQTLIFSIIVNQSDQNIATLREAIDQIVILLGSLKKC